MSKQKTFLVQSLARLTIFLGIAVLLWLTWYGLSWRKLQNAKADIEAQALPVHADQVIPSQIAEEDNAVPLLKQVREIWDQHKDSEEFSALTAQRPNLDQVEEQMIQAEVRSILDLLTQASLKPTAVLDRDYSNILALEMEPLVSMFRASKLLSRNA